MEPEEQEEKEQTVVYSGKRRLIRNRVDGKQKDCRDENKEVVVDQKRLCELKKKMNRKIQNGGPP